MNRRAGSTILTFSIVVCCSVLTGCPDTRCSVTVTIEPAAVRALGAQWGVDGRARQDSGETATDLLAGTHTITCSDVNAWVAPQALDVDLTAGQNRHVTMTYTQQVFAPDGTVILDYGTDDWANAVIETADGGFVVVGAANAGPNNRDLLVAKLNADGALVWDAMFGGEDHDEANDVKETSDGGLIVAGQWVSDNNIDACLVKTDADGNEVWSYRYGSPAVTDLEMAYAVVEVADGYVFAGFTSTTGSGDAYLVKVDLGGTLLWAKTFGVAHNGDSAADLLTTADGGFILAGDTQPALEDLRDFSLIKTTASGNEDWSKRYGSPGEDPDQETSQQAFAVTPLGSGYALAGYTRQYQPTHGMPFVGFLVTTDASGNASHVVDYFDEAPNQLFAIDATSDGRLICAGWGNSTADVSGFPIEHEDFLLLKTNAQGTKTWAKRLGNEYKSFERANGVAQVSDGGYIIVGWTTMGDDTNGFDILVVRTDANGNV